jgi:hypothetical protein
MRAAEVVSGLWLRAFGSLWRSYRAPLCCSLHASQASRSHLRARHRRRAARSARCRGRSRRPRFPMANMPRPQSVVTACSTACLATPRAPAARARARRARRLVFRKGTAPRRSRAPKPTPSATPLSPPHWAATRAALVRARLARSRATVEASFLGLALACACAAPRTCRIPRRPAGSSCEFVAAAS